MTSFAGMRSLLRRRGRATGESILFAALSIVNVANFGFHGLASHLLGPSSYGALGALLGLLVAVTVPLTAYQATLTAEVTRTLATGAWPGVNALLRRLLLIGAAGAALTAAAGPALAGFLHLGSVLPAVLIGVYLIPLTAGAACWSALCGAGRFTACAGASLTAVIVRLAAGALLMRAGAGLDGALAASCVSETALAVGLYLLARRGPRPTVELQPGWAEARNAVASSIGLWVLLGLDVVAARHMFSGVVAGSYVAAATTAKCALFVAQGLGVVLVTRFAGINASAAHGALFRAVLLTGGLGLLVTTGVTLAAPLLVAILFGPDFHVSRLLVVLLGLTASELGALYVAVQFHLARRSRRACAAWFGVLAAVAALAVATPSPYALAGIMAAASLLALILSLSWLGDVVEARPSMRGALAAGSDLELTVVVPFYNPGSLLRPNVLRLLDALGRSGVSYEVIAVADGCTDGSPESIADLSPNRVCTIALPRNSGKGEALRTGLRHGRGAYLGFIDSDGDLDPALWQPFLSLLRLYRPDAVIGSKRHPLSVVDTAGFRRLFSRVFQLVNRCLFRLPVGDTQVGLKVFRRELLQDVLPRTRERGFVFDLEVLVLARRLGYRRLMEAPVSLCYQGRSTIRFGTLLRVAVETVALAWRMHTQGPVCQPNSSAGAGAPDPATGRPAPALPLAEAG